MPAILPPPSCNVYTPDLLANAIVKAIGDEPDAQWLEPSHGKGAFLRAIAAIGVPRARIVAVDLEQLSAPADDLARTKRGVNFLQWSLATRCRFKRIVGNPPYISIRRLEPSQQEIAANLPNSDGSPLGLGGNLWHAFVVASLRVLAPGGSLAFVLPSAAEYADYSAQLRNSVRDRFDALELYRCRRPLFDGVKEGTIVAIAKGFHGGPCRFRRREFETRDQLIRGLAQRRVVARRTCPVGSARSKSSGIELGDVATIRLGGVTGDAKFFLLTEADRIASGLPEQACSPVISRSRHLKAAILDLKCWRRLRESGERVWLFNPSDAVLKHKAVYRKLMLPESEGGCKRSAFKVALRNPWYRTLLPEAPHGFMSGMQSAGPWIAMNGMEGLNATNTLYVIRFVDSLDENERFAVALSMLTTLVQKQLARVGRVYADGLVKLEPGSILSLRLPGLSKIAHAKERYITAVRLILSGDESAARALADSSFHGLSGCFASATGQNRWSITSTESQSKR